SSPSVRRPSQTGPGDGVLGPRPPRPEQDRIGSPWRPEPGPLVEQRGGHRPAPEWALRTAAAGDRPASRLPGRDAGSTRSSPDGGHSAAAEPRAPTGPTGSGALP